MKIGTLEEQKQGDKRVEKQATVRRIDSKKPPSSPKTRNCNICGDELPASYTAQYRVFCRRCKERSEVFRFSDWLPESRIVA